MLSMTQAVILFTLVKIGNIIRLSYVPHSEGEGEGLIKPVLNRKSKLESTSERSFNILVIPTSLVIEAKGIATLKSYEPVSAKRDAERASRKVISIVFLMTDP